MPCVKFSFLHTSELDLFHLSWHLILLYRLTPIELHGGDWSLKVVPRIDDRIIAMEHHPTGMTSAL